MKILLAANACYYPPRGGSTRSNLAWLKSMVDVGHSCTVLSVAPSTTNSLKRRQLAEELAETDVPANDFLATTNILQDCYFVHHDGINIRSMVNPAQMKSALIQQIQTDKPDWVLISSEDIGHVLLRTALNLVPEKVVYLAHTPQLFPFGPESLQPHPHVTALMAKGAGIVAISHDTAQYIQQYTPYTPVVIHPPMYGSDAPFNNYGERNAGEILIINPCAIKGISIFLALAQQLPDVQFTALLGWGTTGNDRKNLLATPNIQLRKPHKDIDDVFAVTRLLLVPSLWREGFGLVVVEAMLRGIPVLASHYGGLIEAKQGIPYTIPIQPIERYQSRFDEHNIPIPVVPPQEIVPWYHTLRVLLEDPALYRQISQESYMAAHTFATSLNPLALENWLAQLSVSYSRGRKPCVD